MEGHRTADPVPFTLRTLDGMSLYDRLVTLERDFWGAAGDPDFYRQHLATDAYMVCGPTGVLDRDATIEAVAQSLPWDTYRLEDVRLCSRHRPWTSGLATKCRPTMVVSARGRWWGPRRADRVPWCLGVSTLAAATRSPCATASRSAPLATRRPVHIPLQ